jgi:hypothetical protein
MTVVGDDKDAAVHGDLDAFRWMVVHLSECVSALLAGARGAVDAY